MLILRAGREKIAKYIAISIKTAPIIPINVGFSLRKIKDVIPANTGSSVKIIEAVSGSINFKLYASAIIARYPAIPPRNNSESTTQIGIGRKK